MLTTSSTSVKFIVDEHKEGEVSMKMLAELQKDCDVCLVNKPVILSGQICHTTTNHILLEDNNVIK